MDSPLKMMAGTHLNGNGKRNAESSPFDDSSPSDVKKRHRASWHQKALLERIFQTVQYPDLALRTQLSEQLGMTPRKVQIWFQNRRTKAKVDIAGHPEPDTMDVPSKESGGKAKEEEDVPEMDVNIQNKKGNSLLFIASSLGHSSVSYLLERGANLNLTNNDGQTPLFAAVRNGHDETTRILLSSKNNTINAREFKYGESALHVAALTGSIDNTKALLEQDGIMVNTKDYENLTPLHHSCICGHLPISKLLLEKGADVNTKSSEGFVPLHAASLIGDWKAVELLLQNGAEIGITDSKGFSSLAFAARESKEEVVKILLSRNASLETKTNEGMTPLHVSCCRSNLEVVKRLVECGASLNATNNKKQTPLHLCSLLGYDQIVSYLLDQGANWELREFEGKSSRDYGDLSENKNISSVFKDFLEGRNGD